MVAPLVIFGAGGFARETLDVVDAINANSPTWNVLGFLVEPEYGTPDTVVNGKPILGGIDWLKDHQNTYAVCGIGAPEVRYRLIQYANIFSVKFATLIHPSIIKTHWITIGDGTVITAGCVLSNNIVIGDHVHINPSSTLGHDVYVESYVSLAPGVLISGNVHLYEGAYIGTGANVIEKKSIGAWSIVGAGSTVVKDVPANTTVVGTPAQVIKKRPEGWHLLEN